ncbi:MAG: tetratricopeptide repeat protein [Acidobacteriota bacterium]
MMHSRRDLRAPDPGHGRRIIRAAKLASLALLATLVISLPACGETADLFQRAVSLYQEGKFAEAESALEAVHDPSPTALYNLGNACFKQGKLGRAILYWEKALRLDPLNRDCAGNLELASRLLRDAVPPDETPLPLQWIRAALFALPVGYLEKGTLALWVIANALFLLQIALKNPPHSLRVLGLASLLCCLLAGGLLFLNLHKLGRHSYGIVIAPKESVRSGPGEQNTVLMEIHEGLKVKILNTQGRWAAVKIAGGYSGWLPIESIGVI